MAKSNDFGVGLMHEVAITASKAGWEPENMADFSKDENLFRLVREVQKGAYEIKAVQHTIDCDTDPVVPFQWVVEEHQKGGIIKFDVSKVRFYLSETQKNRNIDSGENLRKELEGRRVLNSNVLYYLMQNTKFIPEEWKVDEEGKTRFIYFWGTIFKQQNGDSGIFCLYFSSGRWRPEIQPICNINFGNNHPAAVLVG